MLNINQLKAGMILESRYELIAKLGDGGFAVVWEVADLGSNGDRKAIKICKKQDIERFRVESNDLQDLQSDRIVKVETFYPENQPDPDYFLDNWAFFVMEKVEGKTLEQLIEKSVKNSSKNKNTNQYLSFWRNGYQFLFHRYPPLRSHISYIQIANWLEQLAEVLEYLHSKNLIYGDLKPSNIMITPDGNIKLIDFGALNSINDPLPSPICTPEYAPTEQQKGEARLQSDFYSFGYTILFALTGTSPFNLSKDWYSLWRSQFPPQLINFIQRATQDNYQDRHLNTEEFVKEARDVARSLRYQFGRWAVTKQMAVVVGIAAIATVSTLALRSTGLLQPLELSTYDQMLRMRPDLKEDPRLLIVNITNDILELSDQDLVNILNRLLKDKNSKPRVIGITLRRDQASKSTPESRIALAKIYQQNSNIFGICSHKDSKNKSSYPFIPETSAPLGFNNLPEDHDRKIRRQILMYQQPFFDDCKSPASFGLLIAHEYLKIKYQHSDITNLENYFLGNTAFLRLKPKANAYQSDSDDLLKAMSNQFQIMLDYRSIHVAKIISIQQLLSGNPSQEMQEMINNRIVLIGRTTIDTSNMKVLPTPYGEMAGTEIIGQTISQIVSSSEDQRPILRPADFFVDLTWMIGISIFGAFVSWRFHFWINRIMILLISLCSLYIVCLHVLIVQGLWLSIIPITIAVIIAILGIMLYSHHGEYKPVKRA